MWVLIKKVRDQFSTTVRFGDKMSQVSLQALVVELTTLIREVSF